MCQREGISEEELCLGGRYRCSRMRAVLAGHFITRLGPSLADAARPLGVSTLGIAKPAARAKAG
ncbi:MAG: hypothetical protein WC713_02355 [Candidatus Methylomirabilota bacterium]